MRVADVLEEVVVHSHPLARGPLALDVRHERARGLVVGHHDQGEQVSAPVAPVRARHLDPAHELDERVGRAPEMWPAGQRRPAHRAPPRGVQAAELDQAVVADHVAVGTPARRVDDQQQTDGAFQRGADPLADGNDPLVVVFVVVVPSARRRHCSRRHRLDVLTRNGIRCTVVTASTSSSSTTTATTYR